MKIVKRPACRETFMTLAVGSHSSFGETERDLSDSPFIRFGGAEVCPWDGLRSASWTISTG
jgi:hypothetical protein